MHKPSMLSQKSETSNCWPSLSICKDLRFLYFVGAIWWKLEVGTGRVRWQPTMFVEKSWHDFMQYPTAQCCNIILHNTHSILICHFWATRQINRAASLTPSQSDIFYMFSYDSEKYSITWYHHSAHPSSILHTICSLLIEDGPTTLNFGYDFFF